MEKLAEVGHYWLYRCFKACLACASDLLGAEGRKVHAEVLEERGIWYTSVGFVGEVVIAQDELAHGFVVVKRVKDGRQVASRTEIGHVAFCRRETALSNWTMVSIALDFERPKTRQSLAPEGTRSQHGLLLQLPFALEALTVSGAQRKHLYNLKH